MKTARGNGGRIGLGGVRYLLWGEPGRSHWGSVLNDRLGPGAWIGGALIITAVIIFITTGKAELG